MLIDGVAIQNRQTKGYNSSKKSLCLMRYLIVYGLLHTFETYGFSSMTCFSVTNDALAPSLEHLITEWTLVYAVRFVNLHVAHFQADVALETRCCIRYKYAASCLRRSSCKVSKRLLTETVLRTGHI